MEIKDIFPTPVGFGYNKDTVSMIDEHQYLIDLPYEHHSEYNMVISKNKFILTSSPIVNIQKFINAQLQEYAKKTLGTSQPLKITQSWCTKHENTLESTFPHTHQNSIISGVYYVNATKESEGLTFHKNTDYNDRYVTWQTDDKLMKEHYWNWRWCKFPVETGLLILFPSQLKHSVEGEYNNNLRCSLAFNTWFDGPIGNENDLSLLNI